MPRAVIDPEIFMLNMPSIIRSYSREHFIPRKGFIRGLIVRNSDNTNGQRQTTARQWQNLRLNLQSMASNDSV